MINESKISTAGYKCAKKIYGPEIFRKIDERHADPNILTGKDAVYALYRIMGMDINYDDIFAE